MRFKTVSNYRNTHRFCTFLFFIGLLSLTATQAAAFEPLANDDHFEHLGTSHPFLSTALIVGNDLFANAATIEILDPPRHGLLRPVSGGFEYQPFEAQSAFYGTDTWTYRLTTAYGQSTPARVTLRVSPKNQPLAGRWPTPSSCLGEDCPVSSCQNGVDTELGWYDAVDRTFFFCDWNQQGRLDQCQRLNLPDTSIDGTALVFDWDGDGWDEPAILNAETGLLEVYEDSGAPCPGACRGNCLTLVKATQLQPQAGGLGSRLTPLAARYPATGTPNNDWIGAYDPVSHEVGLGPGPGGFQTSYSFAAGDPVNPLRGTWLEHSDYAEIHTVGLWSRANRTFDFQIDHTGNSVGRFVPNYSTVVLDRSVPFVARRNICEKNDLAFFDPVARQMILFPISTEVDPGRGAVLVTVPTDPNGWGNDEDDTCGGGGGGGEGPGDAEGIG